MADDAADILTQQVHSDLIISGIRSRRRCWARRSWRAGALPVKTNDLSANVQQLLADFADRGAGRRSSA
jgi:hypothetical protein